MPGFKDRDGGQNQFLVFIVVLVAAAAAAAAATKKGGSTAGGAADGVEHGAERVGIHRRQEPYGGQVELLQGNLLANEQ